jgi:hypothetical protein
MYDIHDSLVSTLLATRDSAKAFYRSVYRLEEMRSAPTKLAMRKQTDTYNNALTRSRSIRAKETSAVEGDHGDRR